MQSARLCVVGASTVSGSRWHGYFINLDRSVDRRDSINVQIANRGLSGVYERFSAIDGTTIRSGGGGLGPGAIGCFFSHHKIISGAQPADGFLHIIEDDVVLSGYLKPLLDSSVANGILDRFDLIYLDATMPVGGWITQRLRATYAKQASLTTLKFNLLNLRELPFLSASSYLVNPRSLSKIGRLLEGEMRGGVPSRPIDVVYLNLVHAGQLEAALFFPFVTTLDISLASKSTIGHDFASRICAWQRYGFFAEFTLATGRLFVPRADRANGEPDTHTAYLDDVLRIASAFASGDTAPALSPGPEPGPEEAGPSGPRRHR
jgi:hypothetical protein